MNKKNRFTVIQGKKQKPSREKLIYAFLIMVAVMLGVHALFSFTHDFIAARLVRTVVSDEGVLEEAITASGVIVRDERLVSAPVTGTLRWVVVEGERLAVGRTVAVLTMSENTAREVTTPAPGLVILHLDGLEGVLQPQSLAEVDVEPTRKLSLKTQEFTDGDLVQQGSILFKVVNNFHWYFVAQLSPGDVTALDGSKSFLMRFSFMPVQEVWGKVEMIQKDDKPTVAFVMQDQIDGCFTERFAEADIIVRSTRGIVLPVSALVKRGDEIGVYTLEKSVVRYRAVDVLELSEKKVVIDGLRKGLQVITNPKWVREGQTL